MQINNLIAKSMFVILSLLWFAVTYLWQNIPWLADHVTILLNTLQGNPASGGAMVQGPLSIGFDIANAMLPLTELFGFIVFVLPLWMFAVIFRTVKAWIPTVS